jgi:hypothetical protein
MAAEARFRPTRRQAVGRGLYLGVLVAAGALLAALLAGASGLLTLAGWAWAALVVAPPVAGTLGGLALRPRSGTRLSTAGVEFMSRFGPAVEPWQHIIDVRAERRGSRTVISLYRQEGGCVQLPAPYSGELLAADPQFELKVATLTHLWRSRKFGGVPTL